MMKCPKCHSTMSKEEKFCSKCGAKFEGARQVAKSYCVQCGDALKADAKFCHHCGAPQSDVEPKLMPEAVEEDAHYGEYENRPRREWKYILVPLIFVPFLVGIFYLLSFRSQNPESQSANTPGNAQPDMAQMMPVFKQIDSLRTVLLENPVDTTALLVLGEMYDIAGKFAEAREYYGKYLEINNNRRDIKLRVLGTLINEHKHEEEEQLLTEILQKQPNDSNIYMHVGDLYERAGKLDKARDYYNRSLQILPNQVDVFMRLASMHFAEKKYAAAKDLLEKVLEKQPGNPHALYNYALALHFEGEHEKAKGYWQKTIAADAKGDIGNLARQALATYENMRGAK